MTYSVIILVFIILSAMAHANQLPAAQLLEEEKYFEIAMRFQAAGDYSSSNEYLEKDGSDSALAQIAYNHFVLKQYGESLYYYKISLDAGYPPYKAYLGIANVYSRSGEPGKAKQFYENAKTLATEEYYYRVINDYAEHFATLGFRQKAISLYKEALSNIKCSHINHCKGLIHMNIAIEYDLKGDTASATHYYTSWRRLYDITITTCI
ncbi:MAG: tetratricopeptide repeat protein [Cyclobacteriaceae bacterium]